ncbi:MAG: carbohydrate kinase family protein [Clostridia bacterium]|nr:carbohydrate kinase family protein [Clostridia bacterium]
MIACVGPAIVDVLVRGFDLQARAQGCNFAESAELVPGGDAVNYAVCLQKLGKEARIVCFTGEDPAAKVLTDHLELCGADTSCMTRLENVPTPVTVIFLEDDGQRNSMMTRAHQFNFHPEADLSWMDGAESVVLASLFRAPFRDPDVVKTIVTEAKRRELPVYADTKLPNAGRMGLEDLKDVLPLMDGIFPNEAEAAYFTGQTEPEAMADGFLSYGVGSVIIKLGADGCLYKSAAETIRLPGLPAKAVDTTGAGDNFAAGFIALRSEGRSVDEALRFANAAGALCTTAYGATTALQDRDQVRKFPNR